jgi:hypothetical protein
MGAGGWKMEDEQLLRWLPTPKEVGRKKKGDRRREYNNERIVITLCTLRPLWEKPVLMVAKKRFYYV